MDRSVLAAEIAKVRWYHSIDLGNGLVTPGHDLTAARVPVLGIPESLAGKSVLDIGAWDGYFSFEAERRGASRVVAADYHCWGGWGGHDGWGTKNGFDLARRILGSRVEDKRVDVLDLSPHTVGIFDLVLFIGVLYHMRHPLLALEKVLSVTGDHLILETHVDMLDCPRPAMAFYPGCELHQDGSNWCGPNPPMVEAMLRDVGFSRVKLHAGPHAASPESQRVVYHAWR
jgi:tRNA (mo5U34)-methyltransferase